MLKGVAEVGDCAGVEVTALELAIAEGDVGAVARVETAEERARLVVLIEDVVMLEILVVDVVGLVVGMFEAKLVIPFSLPSCKLVQNTGFVPSFSTMLKSLLRKVGGAAPDLLRSDTSKWHTHSFPSSRGTRAEPVADTDLLYGYA